MSLLFGKNKRSRVDFVSTPEVNDRIVDVREFKQSGTFKGYRRYKLTTYQEPGVAAGIDHFRVMGKRPFDIQRGLNVKLVFREVSGVLSTPYTVMEVYVDGFKVGVLYNSHSNYAVLLSEPFDKVYVLIEETVRDGVEVYLFAHYPGGAPVKVSTYVE